MLPRFILFYPWFFFSPGSQTLFGKFCIPIIVPNPPKASATALSLASPSYRGQILPPSRPLHPTSPRYPSGYTRGKSARTLPIITDRVRLARHVKDLQSHLLPVQNARNPPTDPPVQGQLHPAICPSRELPAPSCYFQSDSGKLERDSISSRRNPCCDVHFNRKRPTLPSLHSFSASIIICSLVTPFTSAGRS